MANEEHLTLIRQGTEIWNAWRADNPNVQPDLSGADLSLPSLNAVTIFGADLSKANLSLADLSWTTLGEANLSGADLSLANLSAVDLSYANLQGANLTSTNLQGANLTSTNLQGTNLTSTNLEGTNLEGANFHESILYRTLFIATNLSTARNLETVRHTGPSSLDTHTVVQSHGKIPDVFLRGCGVPEALIEHLPSIIGALEPIHFYSCFISYSTKDQDFAQRLYERMQQERLRVWFAPEDMKAGQKVHEQIDQAIRVHDKLVLVLSEHSIQSDWVITEIRKARKAEIREKRQKLFPIGLMNFDALRDWECFDADTGKDLAVEVREYFIPDFTTWKNHDAFEASFARLLRDLKAAT